MSAAEFSARLWIFAKHCLYSAVCAFKGNFLKPVVEDVVNKYLDCGDLTKAGPR